MTEKTVLALFISIFVSGCQSSSHEERNEEYSIGTIRSNDTTYLPVDHKLNGWRGYRSDQFIELNFQAYDLLGASDDPALWALSVRTYLDPVGVVDSNGFDVTLFSDYTGECCLNESDTFGLFEDAESSYRAVSGYIDFKSDREATFSLDFQQESSTRGGNLFGQIVNVQGCWNRAGESGVSGCELP